MPDEDPDAAKDALIWELKLVGRPAGTEYGRSRDDDDAASPNLYIPGVRGVQTQVKIRAADEQAEHSPASREPVSIPINGDRRAKPSLFEEIAKELIEALVAEARPHVERWLIERAFPAIRAKAELALARIAKSRRADRQAVVTEVSAVVGKTPEESAAVADALSEANTTTMSSEEAQRRLVAACLARAFSDEQIRTVLNARIGDADGSPDREVLLENFTPQELEAQFNSTLEANPDLMSEFARMYVEGRIGTTPAVLDQRLEETSHLEQGEK
ncbi:hypothetical protein [Puerhibacterium sp. TATVAM-FAB25]|uniref:hypothetical protein n=1 Tax=Puerhibacterium sp. TATVAM-FAB25 TaxID=3093699 RepID=UPI00397A75EC